MGTETDSARAFGLLSTTTQAALTRIDESLTRLEECNHEIDKALTALKVEGTAREERIKTLFIEIRQIQEDCRERHPLNAPAAPAAAPAATRTTVITWDRIIMAVAVLLGAVGTLTGQCNRADYRRDSRRWSRPAHVQPAPAVADSVDNSGDRDRIGR